MSNKNEPLSRDRREVIRVGGAAAFGAIAAWLTAGGSPVRAEALAQGAPVIDRLTVSVVIDSYQIAVAPDVKVGNVTIKRFGFALSDQPPATAAGIALAVAFAASLAIFVVSASHTMTARAIANVPVDWQVELAPGIDRTAVETALDQPGVAKSIRPVEYAKVEGFVANTGDTQQVTGAGRRSA